MNARSLVIILLVFVIVISRVSGNSEEVENSYDGATISENLKGPKVPLKTDDEVVEREEQQMNFEGYSVAEKKLLRGEGENYVFQAEVNKLMHIIINSLYSNRDIFLREVISNACDALDKVRYMSLVAPDKVRTEKPFEVRISFDKPGNTITILDTGVGMTKEDLVNNLGRIAQSGTRDFFERLDMDKDTDINLIGQFGLGFYSVFLVADTVTVITKNEEDGQYVWMSDAHGSFTIAEDNDSDEHLGRGTKIILHLKEDASEYLSQFKIEELVKRYSEYMDFPIYFLESKTRMVEEPTVEEQEESVEEEGDVEMKDVDDEAKEVKLKKVQQEYTEWVLLNHLKPIWTRDPKTVDEEEYNAFFHALTKDDVDPLSHIHFAAEGDVNFQSVLFIPKELPGDVLQGLAGQGKSVKLYVNKVFVTEEFAELLPNYLTFLRGVVASDDLPLNVSREVLQAHKSIHMITRKLVRKALELLARIAKEDEELYEEFWKLFGMNIKLGLRDDPGNRNRLAKLVRYQSSQSKGKLVSLTEYVERLKPDQKAIFYLPAESLQKAEESPMIERLLRRGYEVLYLVDVVDEVTLQHLPEFMDFPLVNVSKEGLTLDDEDAEREKALKEEYMPLCKCLKTALGGEVEKVVVSNRITTSPAVLVASKWGWSANLERIMRAQAVADGDRQRMAGMKRTLEVNPSHPIIMGLKARCESDPDDILLVRAAHILHDTAAMASGFDVQSLPRFTANIFGLLDVGLERGVAWEAPEFDPAVEEVLMDQPLEQGW